MMEGRMMSMTVSRAPGWEPPKKQAVAPERTRVAAPDNGQETETANVHSPAMPPTPIPVSEKSEAVSMQSES